MKEERDFAARALRTRFLSLLENVAQLSAFVGMVVLLLISIGVTLNVLMRWLFASPIDGIGDVSNLATIIAISAALPLCLAHQGNIKVDLLGVALGPRFREWLDAFGAFILLLFVAGMAWQLTIFAHGKMMAGETTWLLGLNLAPWWFASAAWFWLSTLCQAAIVYKLLSETERSHDD